VAANRWVGKDLFTFAAQDAGMKNLLLLALLVLAGCTPVEGTIATAGVGASLISVVAIQRTPADALYSWVTGRDCSVVRLDQGKTYCRPVEPEPQPQQYCTRGLGAVNCWLDPSTVPGHPRGVADGPSQLTPEQERDRLRSWP
jgi:hypothetical protein